MKKIPLLTATAFIAISTMAFNAMAEQDLSESSKNFIHKASIGNKFEIVSSKLALKKSQNTQVKLFAQEMIDDHGKAGDDLKSTLQSANEDTSAIADSLDDKHKKNLDSLKKLSGDDFDKKYIKAQADAHKETIKLFRSYSHNGDDEALKGFASDTLPTLEKHKEDVDQLKAS